MIRVETKVNDGVDVTWTSDKNAPVKYTDSKGLIVKEGANLMVVKQKETGDLITTDGSVTYSS